MAVTHTPGMAHVKTAVTLPEEIFRKATAEARRRKMSRSRLLTDALAEYLRQADDRLLWEQLNATYAVGPTEEECAWLDFGQRQMSEITEREARQSGKATSSGRRSASRSAASRDTLARASSSRTT